MATFTFFYLRPLLDAVCVCVSVVIDEDEIKVQIQVDAKNVDRLAERAYCRDFTRLSFGSLLAPSRSRSEPFRLTLINTMYTVCPRSVLFISSPAALHQPVICCHIIVGVTSTVGFLADVILLDVFCTVTCLSLFTLSLGFLGFGVFFLIVVDLITVLVPSVL